jgi:hypothetical protein
MIIQVNGIDHKTHRENPGKLLSALKRCPICGRLLSRNGFYDRLVRALQCLYSTIIYRKYCRACVISFTLLPHFLLPRHRHVKTCIVSWLRACVMSGITSLDFLKPLTGYSNEQQHEGKGSSFSDYLTTEKVFPGKSLLFYWLRAFSLRAARLIPYLVVYCIQAGRDFRTIVTIMRSWEMRDSARPLVYAFALCALLFPSLSAHALFEHLVVFLLGP